jgi:chromosome segregation ATPase
MTDYNAELVAFELNALNVKVDKITVNTEASKDRLHEAEKQSALQEQSLLALCEKVESLDEDVKDLDSDIERSNLVSKIIGGIAGGLAVVAAAIGISR